MPSCSRCRREVDAGRQWCPHCGFRLESGAAKILNRGRRLLVLLAVAIFSAGFVVAGYWYVELRPRMKRLEDPMWGNEPSREQRLAVETWDTGWFDREMRLPSGPTGAAWDGAQFVVGNRDDPWGFFRIRPEDGDWMLQTVPVIETDYAQRMNVDTVTWNGTSFVGVTTGASLGKNDTLDFTIHDPSTLQISEVVPAPALTGAIAWDGTSYWISTRRNTRDADEPAHLARLDASFKETGSWRPPGVGCQGLAWDGSLLWFIDVFDQSLIALDVRLDPPAVVHEQAVGSYPSGVVWDGSHLWIADYDGNRMRRVRHEEHVAWSGGRPMAAPPPSPQVAAPASASEEEIAALHEQLRADDWVIRMRAESRLRELGAPIPFARFTNNFREDDAPDKIDLDEFSLEVRHGRLYGSWELYIGEMYFSRADTNSQGAVSIPLFVRYEVTVQSDALPSEVERTFEPSSGRATERDVVLVDRLRPGRYTASVFIHVQYVDPVEGPKILNYNEDSLSVEVR